MQYVSCLVALIAVPLLSACEKKPENLAPAASALASAAPTTERSVKFNVDPKASNVSFLMDAELEKISGRAPDSTSGELFVDLRDLTRSTGLVKVDLLKLSVYQRKRESGDQEFGEEKRDETQNEHMRTWFQISDDTPEKMREDNRYAELKITKITQASPKDLSKAQGAERRTTVTAEVDLRLHGRLTKHTIATDLVFNFDGDTPSKVSIKTKAPFKVGLEAHEVRPRKTFDQLADATLDALGAKVAKVAEVSVELSASARR